MLHGSDMQAQNLSAVFRILILARENTILSLIKDIKVRVESTANVSISAAAMFPTLEHFYALQR